MKFEIIEQADGWAVWRDGVEMARHADQLEALSDIADLLRDADETQGAYSLAMRYQGRP
jgi:hypothetical protein